MTVAYSIAGCAVNPAGKPGVHQRQIDAKAEAIKMA
jgi:hypothetical protein